MCTLLSRGKAIPLPDYSYFPPYPILYDAGMPSHFTVTVMLALEDEFDVEFPVRLLRRRATAQAKARSDAVELADAGSMTEMLLHGPLHCRTRDARVDLAALDQKGKHLSA